MRTLMSIVGLAMIFASVLTGPINDHYFGYPFGAAFISCFLSLIPGLFLFLGTELIPDRPLDLPILHREKKLKRLKASLEEEAKRYHEDTEEEHLLEEIQAEIKAIEATLSGNERVRSKRRSYDLVRKSKRMIG